MHITEDDFAAYQRRQAAPHPPTAPKKKAKTSRAYEPDPGPWGTVRNGWLFLPIPPSTNNAYRDVIVGKSKEKQRTIRVLTKEADSYKAHVTGYATSCGLPRIVGKVKVTLLIWGRGRKDLMNCEKLLIDAVRHILFEDDRMISECRLREEPPLVEGTVSGVAIRVEPFVATMPGKMFEESSP